jgi:hypothetical protein
MLAGAMAQESPLVIPPLKIRSRYHRVDSLGKLGCGRQEEREQCICWAMRSRDSIGNPIERARGDSLDSHWNALS